MASEFRKVCVAFSLDRLFRKKKSAPSEPRLEVGKMKSGSAILSRFPLGGGSRLLGVNCTRNAIHIVETRRDRKGFLFTRHARFPLAEPPDLQSPAFRSMLKRALDSFGARGRGVDIWALLGAADVQIGLQTIPPVPDKQLPGAVFWAIKKEAGQEGLPDDLVYDYRVVGQRMEEGKPRLEVLVCRTSRAVLQPLENLYASMGRRLSGMTIAGLALENILRQGRMGNGDEATCTLYVGAGWSRIDIFQDRRLRMSRDIRTGLNSLVEVLQEEMQTVMAKGVELDDELDALRLDSPEQYLKEEPAGKIKPKELQAPLALATDLVRKMAEGEPLLWHMGGRDFHIENHRIDEIGEPVFIRLARQVERTMEYYSLNFKGAPISKIHLTGPILNNPRLMRALKTPFTIPVKPLSVFTPSDFQDSYLPPRSSLEQDRLTLAAGLALSTDETINLVHTWKEKQQERRSRFLTSVMVGVTAALFAVLVVLTLFTQRQLHEQTAQNREIERRLEAFPATLDPQRLKELIAGVKARQEEEKKLAMRYLEPAMVGEVIRRTPGHVRIERVSWSRPASEKEAPRLEITGHILPEEGRSLEALLSAYSLTLGQSPLFSRTRVIRQSGADGGAFLAFSLQVDCREGLTP